MQTRKAEREKAAEEATAKRRAKRDKKKVRRKRVPAARLSATPVHAYTSSWERAGPGARLYWMCT
jgi:hypothetical protein